MWRDEKQRTRDEQGPSAQDRQRASWREDKRRQRAGEAQPRTPQQTVEHMQGMRDAKARKRDGSVRGGTNRWANTTPEERKAHSRMMRSHRKDAQSKSDSEGPAPSEPALGVDEMIETRTGRRGYGLLKLFREKLTRLEGE